MTNDHTPPRPDAAAILAHKINFERDIRPVAAKMIDNLLPKIGEADDEIMKALLYTVCRVEDALTGEARPMPEPVALFVQELAMIGIACVMHAYVEQQQQPTP